MNLLYNINTYHNFHSSTSYNTETAVHCPCYANVELFSCINGHNIYQFYEDLDDHTIPIFYSEQQKALSRPRKAFIATIGQHNAPRRTANIITGTFCVDIMSLV